MQTLEKMCEVATGIGCLKMEYSSIRLLKTFVEELFILFRFHLFPLSYETFWFFKLFFLLLYLNTL